MRPLDSVSAVRLRPYLAGLSVAGALAFVGACDGSDSSTPNSEGGASSSGSNTSSGSVSGQGAGTSSGSSTAAGGSGAVDEAASLRQPDNLLVSVLGKTSSEVEDKLKLAADRLFGIGSSEESYPSVNAKSTGYRLYYEDPADSSQAFIWSVDSDDIRSEGLSYGMFIAVELGYHEQFDKLWKFAKTRAMYAADSTVTPWRNYFRWQATLTRSGTSLSFNYGSTTVPAPDGEQYFAAALYLAHLRWGDAGNFNYLSDAQALSSALLNNPTVDLRTPAFDQAANQVVFVPYGNSAKFTDPSYHLPAFYELFARLGPAEDAARWRSIAQTSREFLVASAHATTGLHSDYASFAGLPCTSAENPSDQHDQFRYDAWRVVMNMAVDYAWISSNAGLKAQVEKYHAFFSTRLSSDNVTNSLFMVDGTSASGGGSTALVATLAAGALASEHASRKEYLTRLWGISQQAGLYRYYQETVYLLGLMAASGRYTAVF